MTSPPAPSKPTFKAFAERVDNVAAVLAVDVNGPEGELLKRALSLAVIVEEAGARDLRRWENNALLELRCGCPTVDTNPPTYCWHDTMREFLCSLARAIEPTTKESKP